MNQDDPIEDMIGCEKWCEESQNVWKLKNGKGGKQNGYLLGKPCRKEIFSTTREIYTQFLRDRDQGVQNNQQIRERLLKTASLPKQQTCAAGLYCATVSTPMIESLIVDQNYEFPTGPLDSLF